jgi:RNA polymerase sigma-70 factor (ECF subfamily)
VRTSERILVWRLKRGDREACRELIARHHAGVYGYLRHLGADAHRAEDLTQETYARAWRAIGSLRGAASLRSWLLAIARNEWLQEVRARRPEAAARGEIPELPDPRPGAQENLEESERDRRLRRAVAGLEAPLAEAVALHYFQGLSLREVGRVQGIPTGTAKSRINRSLERLRTILGEEERTHAGQESRKAPAGAP